jgi:hypothetical protein
VRRLAQPEDLLLDLREALVPALHGEVPPRDHHAEGVGTHRREEQVGEHLEGLARLDLEHHAEVLSPELREPRPQGLDVGEVLDERQPDHVRVGGHETEVAHVLLRNCGEAHPGIGQVDPLFGEEPLPLRPCLGDLHPDLIRGGGPDDAADLPVVEPDPLPRPDGIEHLREGAGNRGRLEDSPLTV